MTVPSTSNKDMPTPIPLRILFLHGYTQNSQLFRIKTAGLVKALKKAFPSPRYDLRVSYPQAPHKLAPSDIPNYNPSSTNDSSPPLDAAESTEEYGWWRRKDRYLTPSSNHQARGQGQEQKPEIIYEGLDHSINVIADCIRSEGPFDGVIGFSQGAALAAMVAALLDGRLERVRKEEEGEEGEEAFGYGVEGGVLASFLTQMPRVIVGDSAAGARATAAAPAAANEDGSEGIREEKEGQLEESTPLAQKASRSAIQPPFKFTICYSGFRAPSDRYSSFYHPPIQSPILHMLGALDVVVEEARSKALIEACRNDLGGKVVVHPGGHFVPVQRVWVDAVVGFVRDCLVRSGEGDAIEDKPREREREDVGGVFD